MKTYLFFISLFFLTLFLSCSESNNESVFEMEPLTENDIADILFLLEEEKLARDVYLFSFEKYGSSIFNNISKSEQQHMNQVLNLINLYGLTSIASSEIGIFNNSELQNLYNSLIEKSTISLTEALKVGATIEDLDINDIEQMEHNTNNKDLLIILANLKCGSRNHLRNYISQLKTINEIYEPQFITIEEFDEIVQTSNEKCGLLN
jgi:hypothetical protein